MATVTNLLTLDEFRARYAAEKPYYEYWFGEAVQKSVPTWLHNLLAKILVNALDRASYESVAELELRIDQDWQPKPDVAAASIVEQPYPTKPIDVVAEVLSPDDCMQRVIEKCRQYVRIGIPAVFVMDPELRYAWEWSRQTENLERISTILLPNGEKILVADLWKNLDLRLRRSQQPENAG
jgi:Uma2 family endonuclease